MTLIVGIRCEEGIVLGADGVATLGTVGQTTVRQRVKKLTQISESVIIGTSGHVGLGQRFTATMRDAWDNKKLLGKNPSDAMNILRSAFWTHAELEFNVAKVTAGILGPQAALSSAMSSTVVALPINKEPCLIQFDHQCSPELATGDLPFISVGSGQPLADSFLAFIRRIFWSDRPPKLNEGVLAAIWSLDQAILTNPGGVGDPIQIMTLQKTNGNWRVRELDESDFGEHREAIKSAEASLRNFRESLVADTRADAPPTPT